MQQYNVLTDFHHASLLQSFILLFEKRLGGQVYRPIGLDWATQGYWKVYDHPATQAQYLGIGSATPDGTPPLNEVPDGLSRDIFDMTGHYICQDIDSGRYNKAITLDAFFKAPFNIVIASMPVHIEPFKRLCALHPNKPKLIYQIGNAWTIEAGHAKNIMASAVINNVPPDVNFIQYHQEFDLEVFEYKGPSAIGRENQGIYSFVNVFNGEAHFKNDWVLFQEVERNMPGWTFKSYGGQCRDGAVGPSNVLANKMREARFIWHTKSGGDGYGHVIHNALAVGRPLIVRKSDYAGKLADALLVDGVTCIDVGNLSTSAIIDKIKYYNETEHYKLLCQNAYSKFKEVVDFDKEELQLRKFLESLQ